MGILNNLDELQGMLLENEHQHVICIIALRNLQFVEEHWLQITKINWITLKKSLIL